MPIIDINPTYLSECDLMVASDDFAAHVSAVEIVPTLSSATWQGMKKNARFTASNITGHTLNLNYAQDWDSAKSLSQYLAANAGTEKEFTFRPKSGGKGWKVKVLVQPGKIGGQVNTHATADVSLGVIGDPVPVAAGA